MATAQRVERQQPIHYENSVSIYANEKKNLAAQQLQRTNPLQYNLDVATHHHHQEPGKNWLVEAANQIEKLTKLRMKLYIA